MKLNALLATVAVGGLLLLVGRYELAPRFLGSSSTDLTQSATITVTGHSDESLTPDTALIDANIVTSTATAAAAEQQNTQAVKTVIDALTKAGVQKSDVRTLRAGLQNSGQTGASASSTSKSFQVVQTVEVKVTKLDNLGIVADTLVKAGATQITHVAYQESGVADVQQQGYTDALADARAKADALVQAMGATVTGIQAVNTERTTASPNADDGSAGSTVSGSENLSTTVTVVYTIGNGDNISSNSGTSANNTASDSNSANSIANFSNFGN